MTYNQLMEKVLAMGAEFRIIPCAGFIQVKLIKDNETLYESNIGWDSFRVATIRSFRIVLNSWLTKIQADQLKSLKK